MSEIYRVVVNEEPTAKCIAAAISCALIDDNCESVEVDFTNCRKVSLEPQIDLVSAMLDREKSKPFFTTLSRVDIETYRYSEERWVGIDRNAVSAACSIFKTVKTK